MMYRLTGGNYLHSSHEVPLPDPDEVREPEVPPPFEPAQDSDEKDSEAPKIAEFEFGQVSYALE